MDDIAVQSRAYLNGSATPRTGSAGSVIVGTTTAVWAIAVGNNRSCQASHLNLVWQVLQLPGVWAW